MEPPRLTIETGERKGRTVELDTGVDIVIGREETERRLDLPDATASHRHARILFKGDRVLVEDLGSPGGTLVNGESVARCPLEDGDAIQIGETRLVFHRPAPAPSHGNGNGAHPETTAPHVDLDLPPPKPMPHFDRPETKHVNVKLVSARERARQAKESEQEDDAD
jgi:pSer/pThr/pTyr-binding forkhead associated (FHA) protein